jgi:hypothetical protein
MFLEKWRDSGRRRKRAKKEEVEKAEEEEMDNKCRRKVKSEWEGKHKESKVHHKEEIYGDLALMMTYASYHSCMLQ